MKCLKCFQWSDKFVLGSPYFMGLLHNQWASAIGRLLSEFSPDFVQCFATQVLAPSAPML